MADPRSTIESAVITEPRLTLVGGAHDTDRPMGAVVEVEHDDHIRQAARRGCGRDHELVRQVFGMHVRPEHLRMTRLTLVECGLPDRGPRLASERLADDRRPDRE